MQRIPAEFQHVPLSDSQVLQQLPRAVRGFSTFKSVWLHATKFGRELRHRLLEIGMGRAASQQFHQFVAQRPIPIHHLMIMVPACG